MVTGNPDSGKSALLSRLFALAYQRLRPVTERAGPDVLARFLNADTPAAGR